MTRAGHADAAARVDAESGRAMRAVGELLLTALVLAGATISGSVLLAVAEHGDGALHDLIVKPGIPGAVAVIVAPLPALWLGQGARLGRAVLLGAAAGIAGTAVLEAVREIGLRVFDSMPGDLPMLMGVSTVDGRGRPVPLAVTAVLGAARSPSRRRPGHCSRTAADR